MIQVGNLRATKITLRVPWFGCWEARAELAGPAPAGAVMIDWRGWNLLGGEVDPERSGTFQGQGRVTIVGGLRWSTLLPPREYTADNGLLALTIARDAATAAGITAPVVDAAANRALGRYWPRRRETAGSVLTRLFGRSWWFGLDGVTRAGARPLPALGQGVDVLLFDPAENVIDLFAPRPDAAPLGAVVRSPRLPGPKRVIELMVRADGSTERVQALTRAA